MNKSKIRSKILKLRKKNFNENLKINCEKFFSFFQKHKFNLKNLGGYYPSNFEIDDLEILEFLEKKNTIPEAKEVFMVSNYIDKNLIKVSWEIKDGFYLYLNSVQVEKNANIIPYTVIYSNQSIYSDEFFGTTEILRKDFKISINYFFLFLT